MHFFIERLLSGLRCGMLKKERAGSARRKGESLHENCHIGRPRRKSGRPELVGFEELGDLTVYDRTPHDPAEIRRRIGDAEIVITNKTPLSGETIGACPSIRYIGALSTGYNVIDVAAAAAHGITVTSIPAYCTMDVAQMAFALLLEICCHVGLHDDAVHAGEWTHSEDFCFWKAPLLGLEGKTFGVIGYGRIAGHSPRCRRPRHAHSGLRPPSLEKGGGGGGVSAA